MTKKLLLTAAALGAMAFAGAANAGVVTDAKLSNVTVASTTGGVTTLTPYTIANEATLSATTGTTSVDTTSYITTKLSSGVSLGGGASITLIVTYNLTGPATFETVAYDDLAAVIGGTSTAPSSGVATLSADKKSVQFIVSYTAGAGTIDAFELENVALKVTGKQDVSIGSDVKLVVGATQTTLDTTEATKIVQFKPVLKEYAAVSDTVIASLPDFENFKVKTASAGRPAVATATVATSDVLGLGINTGIYKNLAGGTAVALTDVVASATVTVTGPQIETLDAKLAGVAPAPATLTETSGVFTLTPAQLGTGALVLTAPGDETIEAGAYKAAVKLTAASGFSGLPETTVTLLNVALDGTNFYAPWFALDNGTANSTLRLANNGSAPTGPVTVTLKANNGSAAPTGVYTIPTIPAGAFVSVRGDQLKTAFGTTAANGDLLVTIQSDVANVSAKVRTTQSTGQIYENSLGANPPVN